MWRWCQIAVTRDWQTQRGDQQSGLSLNFSRQTSVAKVVASYVARRRCWTTGSPSDDNDNEWKTN